MGRDSNPGNVIYSYILDRAMVFRYASVPSERQANLKNCVTVQAGAPRKIPPRQYRGRGGLSGGWTYVNELASESYIQTLQHHHLNRG